MTIHTPIDTLIKSVSIGAPVVSGSLFMFPLFGDGSPDAAAPLSLDEALTADLLEIEEVSDAGSVPELMALNKASGLIFLLDGEQVTGVKQNRTFNLSMLLAPGMRTTVPVSCLELGRWARRGGSVQSAEHVHFAKGRAAKMRSVSESLSESRSFRSDQSRVWADIEEHSAASACYSETSAEADIYEARRETLAPLVSQFEVQPRQFGAVFGIGDRIVGLDLFGSDDLYAKVADKLVRSYALDALHAETPASPPVTDAIAAMIDRALGARRAPFPAPGVGETWRFDGDDVAGAALVHDGRCVHFEAFAQG